MIHWAGGGCETLGGRTQWDIGMEDTARHWEGRHCEILRWRTL